MSTTRTEAFELTIADTSPRTNVTAVEPANELHLTDEAAPASAVGAIPDGGYGWTVIFACSVTTFLLNGWSGSWGVMQAALFQAYPAQTSTITLSFVGSLNAALCVGLAPLAHRLSQLISARYCMVLGVLFMSCGSLLSSFTLDNIGGLFATAGISYGLGSCLAYTTGTMLPVQWFSSKLGSANGLVKLGGGLGATIMAIALQALINRVGILWAVRIFGFIALATGVPAALLVRERVPATKAPWIDLSLFKSLRFCSLFLAGAIGTFALYIPPFFLPLFARSIGLSPSTGAGILSGFNACTAVGRFAAGFACDKLGSTNMLLLTMALNAISMLAIWPVSNALTPLVFFAVVNGVANGAFFVTMPTAIGRMIGPGQAAVAIGMALTGWTGGCFMGSPIAGLLIAASGAENAHSAAPYRAAIFYAGGVATASTACVLVARLRMDTRLNKKI